MLPQIAIRSTIASSLFCFATLGFLRAEPSLTAFSECVRFAPVTNHGSPSGIRLISIDPCSSLPRLGLKEGDIITKIYNLPVVDSDSASALFTTLSDADSAYDITVLRDSSELHLVRVAKAEYLQKLGDSLTRNFRPSALLLALDQGLDPNYRSSNGTTLLIAASDGPSSSERQAAIDALLRKGARTNDTDSVGDSALLKTIKTDCPANRALSLYITKLALRADKSMPPRSPIYSTPEPQLCRAGRNTEQAAALLKAGADPNYSTGMTTPLLTALMTADTHMARKLLHAGADPNLAANKISPLTAAVLRGPSPDFVLLLIGNGANVREDPFALYLAAKNGFIQIVRILYAAGAPPALPQGTAPN